MPLNVNDLVPEVGSEYKYEVLNTDGTSKDPQEFIYLKRDFGTPSLTPTAVNRALLMGMQGFVATVTEFDTPNAGNITETNAAGDTLVTSFAPTGDITETFTSGTQVITKITQFDAPNAGDITVTIS